MKHKAIKLVGSEANIIKQLKSLEESGMNINWQGIAKIGYSNGILVDIEDGIAPAINDDIDITKVIDVNETIVTSVKLPKDGIEKAGEKIRKALESLPQDVINETDIDKTIKSIIEKISNARREQKSEETDVTRVYRDAPDHVQEAFKERYVFANNDTISFIKKVVVGNDEQIRLYFRLDREDGYFRPSTINVVLKNREIVTKEGVVIKIGPESIYIDSVDGFFAMSENKITSILAGLKSIKDVGFFPTSFLVGGKINLTSDELRTILSSIVDARTEIEPYMED